MTKREIKVFKRKDVKLLLLGIVVIVVIAAVVEATHGKYNLLLGILMVLGVAMVFYGNIKG